MRDRRARPAARRATAISFATAIAFACAVLAVVAAYDPSIGALLDYRRAAIAKGSWHRLVTCHLVHLSTAHAVLDIAALVLVAWIFVAELTARRMLIVTLAAIAAIDTSLWFLHPEIEHYAGLSGVLHGWFAAGAIGWSLADRRADAFVAKRNWGLVLLAGLAIKLLLEQRGQGFWLDADAMPVVTSAHRWGAAAGAACAAMAALVRRRGATVAS